MDADCKARTTSPAAPNLGYSMQEYAMWRPPLIFSVCREKVIFAQFIMKLCWGSGQKRSLQWNEITFFGTVCKDSQVFYSCVCWATGELQPCRIQSTPLGRQMANTVFSTCLKGGCRRRHRPWSRSSLPFKEPLHLKSLGLGGFSQAKCKPSRGAVSITTPLMGLSAAQVLVGVNSPPVERS